MLKIYIIGRRIDKEKFLVTKEMGDSGTKGLREEGTVRRRD